MSRLDDELPASYALRLTPFARTDIEAIEDRFGEIEGDEIAKEWKEGLLDAIATMATTPRRFPLAPENAQFQQKVQSLTYRRRAGSVAYRILFTIVEEQEDTPFVRILHVRHGAARPITRAEARQIETLE